MIDLHCEDCMEMFKNIPDESIDLFVSDVPYKISGGSIGGGMFAKEIVKKGKVFKHNSTEFDTYLPEIYRVLKNGSHCYIMVNNYNLMNMMKAIDNSGLHFIRSIIWDKERKMFGTYYMSCYEHILFCRKGKAKMINNLGTPDIIRMKNNKLKGADGKNLHDTEKPVALIKIRIENSSNQGDVVMDSFMGIGATGIACKELGRSFIGCEIDETYFNIAKQRIEEAKGI